MLEARPCRQKIRSAVDFQKDPGTNCTSSICTREFFPAGGFGPGSTALYGLQVSFVLVSFKPTPASIVIFHECADHGFKIFLEKRKRA